jgi:tRNA A-37 threonylcarbamoyl transferase component Bud32
MDTQPRRWGAYFLVRPLGGGGMGDVYLALSGRPGFEKACVVKRLTPETLDDPERVKRFRREAEIVRSLSHGAVAHTIAVDDYAGEPFIVQDYIEGKTLTQFVSAARSVDLGTVPVEIAVHIVREMSRALAYAHGAGVIHRDVALDNIMVTFSGEVRLIDFGIARSVSDAALTMPGTIVGRWSYTAPEVLTGARADQRADVYAAGVVLWELLTGRAPVFPVRADPPAPSSLRPDLPPALDAVVLRAIAADPTVRFGSAEELQRALGPFLPAAFAGETALKTFIARCYDVPVLRRRLADELEEAKALRATVESGTRAVPADTPTRADSDGSAEDEWAPPAPARRTWVYVGVVGLGILAAAGLYLFLRKPGPPSGPDRALPSVPATPPIATQPPVSPPPPSETARTPTAAAAPPSAPVPQPASARVATERAVAARSPTARTPSAPVQRPAATVGPSANILLDRARESLRDGDLAAAERDARAALPSGTAAQKATAHFIIGKVLLSQSQLTSAEAELKEALALDPTNEASAAVLARLQRRKP